MREEINLDDYTYTRKIKGRWNKKAGKKDILAEFFEKHCMEEVKVAALDFTFERRENLIRRDSLEEGIKIGEQKKLIALICHKLRKGKTPEESGEDLEEELDVILPICEAARSFSPEYDEEQTAEKFLDKNE